MIPSRLIIVVLFSMLCVSSTQAMDRVALVIGNTNYASVPQLENPANDATALAQKLGKLGFDVTLAQDLDYRAFGRSLGAFSTKAGQADIALIYFAGHGIELSGQNYLIPVDAELKNNFEAKFETIALSTLTETVSSAGTLGMVLVDACRDNPFLNSMEFSGGTRSVSRGLAPVDVKSKGLLVSFAAQSGSTADDGDGDHSPYAQALLNVLDQPQLEVGRMFRKLRSEVRATTNGQQIPMERMQLPDEDIFLNLAALDQKSSSEVPAIASDTSQNPEIVFWNSIKDSGDPAMYQAYLSQYPNGIFASIAAIKFSSLSAKKEPAKQSETKDLGIIDLQVGNGSIATAGQTFSVHYTGTFENGDVFDSSVERNMPFDGVLSEYGKQGGVIIGFNDGILGMRVGGKRRITIPPHLGYGSTARGNIPENSTLIFEVELLTLKNRPPDINTSHILAETKQAAIAIIAELEAGAEFAELAKNKSTGPSSVNGGDLGWSSFGDFVAPFEDAARSLKVSEISGPVKTQFGWHVIRLNGLRDGSVTR